VNLVEMEKLVKNGIERISQQDLIDTIKNHIIPLRLENREWDYVDSFTEYPCYIVLEDKKSNTAVAYCEQGFGPNYPWGLIFIEGEVMSLGMDSGWFASLEEAVRNSMFWHGENPDNYEVQ